MTLTAKLFPVWTPELGAGGMPYTDRYNVAFEGETIVEGSRDPETDLARALLARGHTGPVTLLDGATGKPRLIVNIEKAAKLCVKEGPLRFAPHESRPERPLTAEMDPVGMDALGHGSGVRESQRRETLSNG
jgi:hypothetical protein